MENSEDTLVLVKPDGVQRGLTGEIIARFEKKGLKVVSLKLINISRDLAGGHYAEHKEKPFFNDLVDYITSSPVVAMVLRGRRAVEVVRNMVGATDPADADVGTIRGDLGLQRGKIIYNLVHASDSDESADREINLFFSPDELADYVRRDQAMQ
jgi:nucleoside-diphosphate kinase